MPWLPVSIRLRGIPKAVCAANRNLDTHSAIVRRFKSFLPRFRSRGRGMSLQCPGCRGTAPQWPFLRACRVRIRAAAQAARTACAATLPASAPRADTVCASQLWQPVPAPGSQAGRTLERRELAARTDVATRESIFVSECHDSGIRLRAIKRSRKMAGFRAMNFHRGSEY